MSQSSSTSISTSPKTDALREPLVFVMFDEQARGWVRYSASELLSRFAQLEALTRSHATTTDQMESLQALLKVHDTMLPFNAVVIGHGAGHYSGDLGNSVLLGTEAGLGGMHEFTDYVALGANAQALASRTAMLGNTAVQVHAAQPIATRADARDFIVLKDLDLGLDFVRALKPRIVQMDLREDYLDYRDVPEPPTPPPPPPSEPTLGLTDPQFEQQWQAYQAQLAPWLVTHQQFKTDLKAWQIAYTAWKTTHALNRCKPDGTHRRKTPQTLLLAQEVAQAAQAAGSSFTGLWDGLAHDGLDVQTLRAEELIPVLVKAIQDLYRYVNDNAFLEGIAAKVTAQAFAARVAMRQYVPAPVEKGPGDSS